MSAALTVEIAKLRRADTRMLVTYITTVLIFVFLAWRSEVNNAHIQTNTNRIAVNAWTLCQQVAAVTTRMNTITSTALPVPVCGPKP